MPRRHAPLPSLVLVLVLIVPLLLPAGARADGVIVVDPPSCAPGCPEPFPIGDQLVVRSHRVDVTIKDQIATTRIDQVFHNPNEFPAEGTSIFPIPNGAAIGEFTMWVDGEPAERTEAAQRRALPSRLPQP